MIYLVQKEMVTLLPRLRRFAYGLTTNMDDADDLVQSACEKALTNQDSWSPGTRLDSWLYRIIQNLFLDGLKKKRVRGEVADPEATALIKDPKAHLQVELTDRVKKVGLVLEQLPIEQREVLMLVTVSGFSYQEAADQLNMPVGTVMSRLARGRRKLYELIQKDNLQHNEAVWKVN